MGCVEFAFAVTHFFDDYTQVEPAATALSAELTQLTHFFSQVGYDLKSNDNGREGFRTHRRCSGREFDFNNTQMACLISGTKADTLGTLSRKDS